MGTIDLQAIREVNIKGCIVEIRTDDGNTTKLKCPNEDVVAAMVPARHHISS